MRIDKSSDALMLLGIEHKHMGQVLDVLERQIDLTENSKETDYKLIKLIFDYFLTFPDTCHHPKEDLIFARIIAHKPDELGILGDLIDEHKELSQITHKARDEVCSQCATSLVKSNTVPILKEFLETYRHHIETENKTFFPYVLENLPQEEFDMIDFALFDREDPVYDDDTEEQFARLRDEIVAIGNE